MATVTGARTSPVAAAPVRSGPSSLDRLLSPLLLAPSAVAVFLFDIDTEQGFYRWLAEPVVTRHGEAELRRTPYVAQRPITNGGSIEIEAEFENLDNDAVANIIDRVTRWYEARTYSHSR